ncbi:MAG: hypothetical protein ACI4ES_03130 [Roseburia sp.]
MMNKSKTLSTISIIVLVIEFLICLTLKSLYYIEKARHGFFSNGLEPLLWTMVSISLTLLPSFLILAENIILIKMNREKHFSFLSALPFIIGCVMLCFNIIFGILSLLGSAMSLDSGWTDIAMQMLIFHFSTMIPIVLTIISMILRKK